jgi:hypothetical protein
MVKSKPYCWFILKESTYEGQGNLAHMESKISRERLLGNRRGGKSKAACVYLLVMANI